MRGGGDGGAGTPGMGGVSRKEDYLSGVAEPRRRLQTFPLKRKRRRRGERVGGGECQRQEVVARGPGAGVLGRAQPEGERPGGLRRSPLRSWGGALPLSAASLAAQLLPGPRPFSFPGLVAWKGAVTPVTSGAGKGIPRLLESGVRDITSAVNYMGGPGSSGSPHPLFEACVVSSEPPTDSWRIFFLLRSRGLGYCRFDGRVGSCGAGLPASDIRVPLF